MKRSATAVWNGTGKEGNGKLESDSGVLNEKAYSYKTRFENDPGTNPEELVAAAHAGCFSMKLSFVLGTKGFTPDRIETKGTVTLENGAVTTAHLDVRAKVPGISQEQFKDAAEEAKTNCPISKLLNATITMNAELAQQL
ncbi:MAG TPA: OsmC family protein [Chitinophagales bacterium]|nr:OsmC family protein [Chitinophagales bacterium]